MRPTKGKAALFIGIAILIAGGLALVVSADAGSLIGLDKDQTAQLLPMVLILIVFAGGLFTRTRKFGELFGSLVLWAGLFGVAIGGYAYRDELLGVAQRMVGELSPGAAVVSPDGESVAFRRGIGGHFQVNATINSTEIPLIFDTGASVVVLTEADAKKIGINTEALHYGIPVSTANGTGRAAAVKLDSITVGSIVRNNIRAFVAEPGALETSLLGMTFLETLSRYAVTRNGLELTD